MVREPCQRDLKRALFRNAGTRRCRHRSLECEPSQGFPASSSASAQGV